VRIIHGGGRKRDGESGRYRAMEIVGERERVRKGEMAIVGDRERERE
jgi:hypothetical protein